MSTKGVTYIKINRIDNEGNDNTLTLQGLTNIRIIYSDIGIVNYPVYSIAEYDDYYLYQLVTTNVTSSTDNNIRDYTLDVTSSGGTYNLSSIPADYNFNNDSGGPIIWAITTDIQNYFDTATQSYIFENTSNIYLTCSFTVNSITWIGAVPGPTFYLVSNVRGIITSYQTLGGSPSSVNFVHSGSFLNESLKIQYSTAGGGMSTSNVNFTITQSINPSSTIIDQVVLEPYVTENFEFSDCNVLYGNVDSYPFNPLYMDVDYSTNGMIAINTDQIINGDATRSTVKPYYYSLRRHIRPRYNGSENVDLGAWIFTGGSVTVGIGFTEYTLTSNDSHRFKVGDKIIIYQGTTLKGIATIQKILNSTSVVIYSTEIILDTITVNLQLRIVAGITYLTPNTFENSNVFPLDTFNSDIFEYRYGTTTFPEIPNAGMLVMGNILEVTDQNNVNILQQGSQYFEAYNKIINDTFTPNTVISDIRQYGDGKQVTLNNLRVLTSEFGTPKSPQNTGDIVEYWIPTNDCISSAMAVVYDTTFTFGSIFSSGQGAYEINLNELQQYITASSGLIPSHSVVQNISSSLDMGDRWFITIYNELPNPLDKTSLSPYTLGYISSSNINDPLYPLLGHGIYEIESASNSPTPRFQLKNSVITGSNPLGIGNGQYGVLIWKATTPSPKQGKYVIVSKPNVNELGPGAIVLPDPNDAINNYYNEITTTYGTNTKPPTNQQSKNTSPKPSGPSGLSRR
jgi:hypothetical protein